MSFFHNLFGKVLSRERMSDIEAHSRLWMV